MPQKFGMVEIDPERNITLIIDKPQNTTLKYMWGMAVWSDSFSETLAQFIDIHQSSAHEIVLGDAFTLALKEGMCVKGTIFHQGRYIDIGTPEGLDEAIRAFSVLKKIT
jgi:glucose-1-phosphate thymidylyltransferase